MQQGENNTERPITLTQLNFYYYYDIRQKTIIWYN